MECQFTRGVLNTYFPNARNGKVKVIIDVS